MDKIRNFRTSPGVGGRYFKDFLISSIFFPCRLGGGGSTIESLTLNICVLLNIVFFSVEKIMETCGEQEKVVSRL